MFIPELPPGIAPGFEFNPSNELLITKYLKPKILGTDPDVDLIVPEIDCCKFEPRELPAKSKIKSKDKCLFFSEEKMECKIGKIWKITNGRTTKEGFWKITCKERVIKDEETEECIGKKRILTFYRGSSASKEKTNWVMHQYYIFPDHPLPNQKIYVLCYVKKQQDNKANSPDRGEGEPSSTATSEIENHVPPAATSVAYGHEEEHRESYSGACNFRDEEFAISQPSYSRVCNFTGEEFGISQPSYPRVCYFTGEEFGVSQPSYAGVCNFAGEGSGISQPLYSGDCNFTEDGFAVSQPSSSEVPNFADESLEVLLSKFFDPNEDEHPEEATNSCIPQASSWKRG